MLVAGGPRKSDGADKDRHRQATNFDTDGQGRLDAGLGAIIRFIDEATSVVDVSLKTAKFF